MNTIIGCILLSLVIYSFVKLFLQGIKETKQDKREELEIWECTDYNIRDKKSA